MYFVAVAVGLDFATFDRIFSRPFQNQSEPGSAARKDVTVLAHMCLHLRKER
jgi:hypothetical protein